MKKKVNEAWHFNNAQYSDKVEKPQRTNTEDYAFDSKSQMTGQAMWGIHVTREDFAKQMLKLFKAGGAELIVKTFEKFSSNSSMAFNGTKKPSMVVMGKHNLAPMLRQDLLRYGNCVLKISFISTGIIKKVDSLGRFRDIYYVDPKSIINVEFMGKIKVNDKPFNNMQSESVKISEGDIRKMVMESVKRILGEANEFARGIPAHIRDKFIKKVAAEHPELDPNGFYYTSTGDLLHNGKKRPKRTTPKPVISKPEGMSDEEYEQKLIIPNNPKYREDLEKYPDEEFRPLINGGRYYGGETEYGNDYEISNKGRIKVINHGNVLHSRIIEPNHAETKKGSQAHIMAYDEGEGKMKDTCSNVAYMVANAFLGEHDPSQWLVKHKDGDWRNNCVENLEWVPSVGKVGKFSKKKQ